MFNLCLHIIFFLIMLFSICIYRCRQNPWLKSVLIIDNSSESSIRVLSFNVGQGIDQGLLN